MSACVLFFLHLPKLLLLLEALHDLLPESTELYFLLGLELCEQVPNFAVAHDKPFLIFLALDVCDLALNLVGADVVFLLCQLLLHLPQVDYLAGFALAQRNRLLHDLGELLPFTLVLLHCLCFQSLRLGLILFELRVPVSVELPHFLQMRRLDLTPLLLKPAHQLCSPLAL